MCDVCKSAGETDKIVVMAIFMAPFLVVGCEHVNMLYCVDDLTQAGPDRAPITPPNLFAHSQLISHAPRSPMHLLTHVLDLTSPASNPCRARVLRPYSPSFSFITQRNNKKVCHTKTPTHSPTPHHTSHASTSSLIDQSPSLKVVASSAY